LLDRAIVLASQALRRGNPLKALRGSRLDGHAAANRRIALAYLGEYDRAGRAR